MKKKYIVMLSLILLILFLLLGMAAFFAIKSKTLDTVYLRYGDKIDQIQVYDMNNNAVSIQTTSKYTLLFYLSAYCGSCIEYLPEISLLYEILSDVDIEIKVVWLENPPKLQLSKNNLPYEINYSMGNKIKLDSSTPTYYLLDENGTVIFKDVVATNLIDKATELGVFSSPSVKERLNDYVRREYGNPNKGTLTMVYFALEGCADCAKADEMIYNKNLEELFTIYRIYSYRDSVTPRDRYKIYKNIYEISWYPSFLILSEDDYRFVGNVEFAELEDHLRKAYTEVK